MSKNRHYNVQDSRPNGGVASALAGKVAPAVALLLLGESAFAIDDEDDSPVVEVPEPGALALFAAGAAAAGAVKYIRKKRGK